MAEPDTRPRRVTVTRTHKLGVSKTINAGKRDALIATDALYQRVVRWYADLALAHSGVLDAPGKGALTVLEAMTVPTSGRTVAPEWDAHALFGVMPRDFRRAAINAAVGAVKGHLAAVSAWEAQPVAKRGKRPQFGLSGQHPVLYGQQGQVTAPLLKDGFVRVKALTGDGWAWVNVPVTGRPNTLGLLARADAEKARQRQARDDATARCLASGRLSAKGKPAFTPEERESFRLAPGAVQAQSPTLVVRRGKISVNVPITSSAQVVKAEDGRRAGLHQRVVTVDSNTFNVSVVAWDGDKVIGVRKLSYGAMQSNRERQVGKAIAQSRLCRGRNRGERQSAHLWDHITNLGETCARQVAAWITAFAIEHGATVIVTEHLDNYRPERGTRSKRANRRRSYWLRGRIHEYTDDAAICHGILTVQRNPAWTSHQCPKCHRLGERFSESRTNPDNKSRLKCLSTTCGWTGDADIAAALNLHRKWTRTFTWPTAQERAEHKARQQRSIKSRPRGRAPGTANPRGDAAPVMFETREQVAA